MLGKKKPTEKVKLKKPEKESFSLKRPIKVNEKKVHKEKKKKSKSVIKIMFD